MLFLKSVYIKWLISCFICSDYHGPSPKSNSPSPAQLSGVDQWALQSCEFITHKYNWVSFDKWARCNVESYQHYTSIARSSIRSVVIFVSCTSYSYRFIGILITMLMFCISFHYTHLAPHTHNVYITCPIGNAALTSASSVPSPYSHESYPPWQAFWQPDRDWGASGSCH